MTAKGEYLIKYISIMIFACFCTDAKAQQKDIVEIRNYFNNFREQHFQEKIYLHTDKSLYITGEILWSKAYIVDAHLHHSTGISKIAYIEIIDDNQQPVWQSSIGIEKGKGEASLVIPSSFRTGNYILRCYTNWMKNRDAAFFFEKNITIINPIKKPISISSENMSKVFVDFFPEGGYLVTGLPSNMAIKATDESGIGMQVKGVILIPGNDTILRFETNEKGFAKCLFTPLEGISYEARIQETGRGWQTFPLPEIEIHGYTMYLDDTDPEFISVTVNSNLTTAQSTCYLFVHCRQTFIQALTSEFFNGKAIFKLPKSGIGEGISHFTIFNESRQPVMERLYFKRPEKLLKISVATNKKTFKTRELVTLDIESKLAGGAITESSLSASIVILDSNQSDEADNIVHYLYLQSDLTRWVESPGTYFGKDSGEMADLLMLTHGWRRFNWKEILSHNAPSFEFLPEYSGQIISGKLVDNSRQPVGSGKIAYASIPSNRYQLGISRSNESGSVQFPFGQNPGTAELVLQADINNDSLPQVDWQSPFSKKYSSNKAPSLSISGKSEAGILEMIRNTQLYQVYSGEKMNSFVPPDFTDTTSFFGLPDKNYLLDNYTRFTTMEEIFREFIPEVEIRKNKSDFRILVNNLPFKTFFREEPLMILDGVPVTDVNKVMQFDPLKIKNIGIVARRYYVSGLTYPGIISFQTYEGDLTGFNLDPRALIVDYEGIQVKREFYSPQYLTESDIQNRLPDLRRLLYWAPNINTGATGKTRLSFYTADLPGRYAIKVEGMNDKGFAGSSLTYFEVR